MCRTEVYLNNYFYLFIYYVYVYMRQCFGGSCEETFIYIYLTKSFDVIVRCYGEPTEHFALDLMKIIYRYYSFTNHSVYFLLFASDSLCVEKFCFTWLLQLSYV